MEWSSESAAVRRHRGTAERREGQATASHPQREASAQEDARGGGRMRGRTESGGESRGAKTALSEARTALALALYLLALRALVQLSLQRLVLSRTTGLQGEFDARQARYGRSAGPRVLCGPGRVSPGWGSAGSVSPARVSWEPLCPGEGVRRRGMQSPGVLGRTSVGNGMVPSVLLGSELPVPGTCQSPSFAFSGWPDQLSLLYHPLCSSCR